MPPPFVNSSVVAPHSDSSWHTSGDEIYDRKKELIVDTYSNQAFQEESANDSIWHTTAKMALGFNTYISTGGSTSPETALLLDDMAGDTAISEDDCSSQSSGDTEGGNQVTRETCLCEKRFFAGFASCVFHFTAGGMIGVGILGLYFGINALVSASAAVKIFPELNILNMAHVLIANMGCLLFTFGFLTCCCTSKFPKIILPDQLQNIRSDAGQLKSDPLIRKAIHGSLQYTYYGKALTLLQYEEKCCGINSGSDYADSWFLRNGMADKQWLRLPTCCRDAQSEILADPNLNMTQHGASCVTNETEGFFKTGCITRAKERRTAALTDIKYRYIYIAAVALVGVPLQLVFWH